MTDITDRAVESIVRQFSGGEHKLAGARASELVYGKGNKANEKMMAEITEKAPGIERYISPPEMPVTRVTDQGGDPLSRQPENDPDQLYRSNMSNAQAVAEQNEIDKALASGREKGGDDDGVGETKLNPGGSTDTVKTSPAKPTKTSQKAD